MKILRQAMRLANNLILDLRYGAFLGWKAQPSPFAGAGANDSNNSEYGLMEQIFAGRIAPDDILVDVGCGRGRVINWWLNRGISNPLYGLELDPGIARQTAQRLRHWPQVTILAGNAIENLPPEATLYYLFNPFNAGVMAAFRDRVIQTCTRPQSLKIVYYTPVHLDVFLDDPCWMVEKLRLDMSGELNFSERHCWLALIRPRMPATAGVSGSAG